MPDDYYRTLFSKIKYIKEILKMTDFEEQSDSVRDKFSVEHCKVMKSLLTDIKTIYTKELQLERQ
jgi:hypothetical protein